MRAFVEHGGHLVIEDLWITFRARAAERTFLIASIRRFLSTSTAAVLRDHADERSRPGVPCGFLVRLLIRPPVAAFLGKKPDDFLAIRQVWGGNAHGKATGRRERRIRNFTISFIRHNPSTGSSRSRIHETRTILKKNDAVCGGELKVVEKESRQHPERHGRVCGARVRPWPRSIMRRNQKRAC